MPGNAPAPRFAGPRAASESGGAHGGARLKSVAMQLGALRVALLEAGVSEDKANAAAEELAFHESRLASADVKMEKLDDRITLVIWQLGVLIGGMAILAIKAFS